MSTSLANGAPSGNLPKLTAPARVAIVTARWNNHITGALTRGATALFESENITHELHEVPGAVELTYGASALSATGRYDAVIVFGCVIRGGTPHFDYVCQSVTDGVTRLNSAGRVPVIFGVLTVDTEQDAIDRAGGKLGNKGTEAAEAAIMMIDFTRKIR